MKTYLSFFASMFDSTIWVMTQYSRWLICSKIYRTGLVTQTHQNVNCADLDRSLDHVPLNPFKLASLASRDIFQDVIKNPWICSLSRTLEY